LAQAVASYKQGLAAWIFCLCPRDTSSGISPRLACMGACDSRCLCPHDTSSGISPDWSLEACEKREEFWNRGKEILRSGAIRLLSAKWLLQQPDGFVIRRRQDLPEEAFVPVLLAAELPDTWDAMVVISYGWLTKEHPDPQGFHMRSLRIYLSLHRSSPQTTVGVFWDFASLPQKDASGMLSEEDKSIFKAGLKGINILYGGQMNTVIQLTQMPVAKDITSGDKHPNSTPYSDRGWCFFEATTSSVIKNANLLLDLGLATQKLEMQGKHLNDLKSGGKLIELAARSRLPPLTPEDMRAELSSRTFTNGADREMVCSKYAEFFERAAEAANNIQFWNSTSGPGWGDEEFAKLAKALPYYKNCYMLDLYDHRKVGPAGIEVLVPVLQKLRNLYLLNLSGCTGIGEAGIAAVRRGHSKFFTLKLPYIFKGTKEGKLLEEVWVKSGKTIGDGQQGSGGLNWV